MANICKMRPDLMGSSGFKPAVELGGFGRNAKFLDNTDPGHGLASTFEPDRLALPVRPVPAKLGPDPNCPTIFQTNAPDAPQSGVGCAGNAVADSRIDPFNLMLLKLTCQPMMRTVGLCDHEQPRRTLVDPVNYSRAPCSAHAG